MEPVSDKGECICKEGYRAIEFNKLGFPIVSSNGRDMIKCEECPLNQYQGPPVKTIWECVACPDPVMVYDARFQCSCPSGYRRAGDGCISRDHYDELFNLGFASPDEDEIRVQYGSVHELSGSGTSSVFTESDVFVQFYYQSAVGCKFYQDQR